MIKPSALKRGDKVAIMSLSSGMGGDLLLLHRYGTAPVPFHLYCSTVKYLDYLAGYTNIIQNSTRGRILFHGSTII